MNLQYVTRRLGAFFITIFLAATLNFAIPRLTPQDPVAALLGRMGTRGGQVEGGQEIVELYRRRFGLDQPIAVQYLRYLDNLFLHGHLGYSLAYFPATVESVIYRALPWTLGLFSAATLLTFLIGNLLGALPVWPKMPRLVKLAVYLTMPLSAIPYYLLALILLYLLAFQFPIFPMGGTFTLGSVRDLSWDTLVDLLHHSALPILSIVLANTGFWALSMRGTMSMTLGEDFLSYARVKGLRESRIFIHYAIRNAWLPQLTALALDFGRLVSGQVLVEIIFNYPGMGLVLFTALRNADYGVIQGVAMFIVVSVALATLLVDLAYPLLDPRIRYQASGH